MKSRSAKHLLKTFHLPIFLFLTLPIILFALYQSQDIRQKAAEFENATVQELTQRLIRTNEDYKRMNYFLQPQKYEELRLLAQTRKQKLLEEMRRHPDEAANALLSQTDLDQLDDELKQEQLVERPIQTQGKLRATIIDYATETEDSELIVELIPDVTKSDESYNVYFADLKPSLSMGGMSLDASGFILDNDILILNSSFETQTLGGLLDTNFPSQGSQKIEVLLHNYEDNLLQPKTLEQVTQIIFSNQYSLKNFYAENSFDTLSFSGSVHGYFTLPPRTDGSSCNNAGIGRLVDAAAQSHGINLTPETARLYFFLPTDCSTMQGWAVKDTDGVFRAYIAWARANGGTPTHEVGHLLGLAHANYLDCGEDIAPGGLPCYEYEYGDITDTMGYTDTLYHFNAAHKAALNWIPPTRVATVTENGTFTVTPLESAASENYQLLVIPVPGVYRYYLVGYRQPIGFDGRQVEGYNRLADETNYFDGVQVHLIDNSDFLLPTYLLNASGNSLPFAYGAIEDGHTFYDRFHGVKITQISHNSQGAQVTVEIVPSASPSPTPPLPSPSVTTSASPIPSPSVQFSLADLTDLLNNYLGNFDAQYQPKDKKINMLDAAYVMMHLE
ncbi:hypothetical protein C4579_02530 [Candidatus Microgenomates bacterium]|nr:MAG: hypothetical protein C4579_02530 [Candidatus Microgenomates bacterium]